MKKTILLIAVIGFNLTTLLAQDKLFTKQGHISFYSEAPTEKIEAVNNKVTAVLDSETGAIQFAVLIRAFTFEKALMQEHFNENYLESEKFPKATFKGKISNYESINWTTDGSYSAQVTGDLTIHGVTQPVETDGTFVIEKGEVKADSKFIIAVADYDIEIPKMVRENIAKEIEITVSLDLDPLKAKGSAEK